MRRGEPSREGRERGPEPAARSGWPAFDETTLRAALPRWGYAPDARLRRLNVSENVTLRVDGPGRDGGDHPPLVLRLHRPGYRADAEIAAEMAWLEALRHEGAVPVAAPVRMLDGGHTLRISARTRLTGFPLVPGREPAPGGTMEALGALTARLHAHALRWTPPPGFVRPEWTHETTLGANAVWGDWRAAPGLDPAGLSLLERASARIAAVLETHGRAPDRFTLLHADLRAANLLEHADGLTVIDFDDCGHGWLGWDFAGAVSFLETDPRLPEWRAAWLAGYRRVRPFPAEDEALLEPLVVMRRMLLTAWLASRAGSDTAAAFGGGAFTAGTLALAARYLAAA